MSTKFWSPMVQVMTCQQFVAKPSHAGLGSIQSQNSKCSSIAIPELELELKQVELKTMELELQTVWMELKFYNCYCTAEMSLGSRLVVLLFVTKVLGICTCTWLKKYLVYLMPSKHFEYLYLQIWKSTCTWLNYSESAWMTPTLAETLLSQTENRPRLWLPLHHVHDLLPELTTPLCFVYRGMVGHVKMG